MNTILTVIHALRPSSLTHSLQIYCTGSQVQDPIHLGLGLQSGPLQLAPSMGKARVLVSATVNHGRIKLPSVRVPRENHFGGGACYTEASPLFPRIHSYCHNSASAQGYSLRY